MTTILDLALGISIINFYYSLSYILMWCVELQHASVGDQDPVVWLAVYTFNLMLNTFLFIGLRKRDRLAVIIWFSLTLLWFVPKLYGHIIGCRLDRRGAIYQLVNLLMELYVVVSFIIMALVYIYLSNNSGSAKRTVKRQRSEDNNQNAAALNIQMVELLANTNKSSLDELPSSSRKMEDQQIRNVDFHRADD